MSTPVSTLMKTDFQIALRDYGVKRRFKPGAGTNDIERTITVIEDRETHSAIPGFAGSLTPVAMVMVLNDAFKGILRSKLDTSKATIQVSVGGTLEFRPVARVVEERSDDAVLVLEVR